MIDARFIERNDGNAHWSVLDTKTGSTAIVQGRTLARISRAEANDMATLLNMIAGIRRELPRRSVGGQSEAELFLLPIR